jgi:hypothetical protein
VAPPTPVGLPPLPGPEAADAPAAGNPWMSFAPPPVPTMAQVAALPSSGLNLPKPDRAPNWVLALSGLVIVALVVGAAYVATEGRPGFPKEWDKRVAPIADWVADARGLEFEHPVEVLFLSPSEYRAAATGDPEAAQDEKEAEDSVAQLRALGMVSGDVDLDAAGKTLADSGTLAYYDPSEKKVFVRGTDVTPALRVTLAHELTHVLQDQHFDLERMKDLPEEKSSVLRALAEGDATRIEDEYIETLSADERKQYEDESDDPEATKAIDDKVPPALTAFFSAPYAFGPTLASFLDRKGGDEELDAAFRDPPSEEVLFDPRLHGSLQAEPQKVSVGAPDGTEKLDDGYFGPIAWYLVLASRMEPSVAMKAVDGMGGDHYAFYRQQSRVCVRIYAVGDDATQVRELDAALKTWVAKSPAGTASVSLDGDTVHFQSCDPGGDAPAVGKVTPELLGLPVGRAELYLQLVQQGASEEQASCYANTLLDRVSFDQIMAGYLKTSAGQPLVGQIRSACT